MNRADRVGGSFRDPSGFLFRREGVLYRQINEPYREAYEQLLSSGLYDGLVADGLLVSHREASADLSPGAFKIIEPEPIPFISYPYEWCFSQLQDAALATLEIQRRALEQGMVLKDASAYNVQFRSGRPVLIDTLSFDPYIEGRPWVAYRQFCQHFLAPLALMSYRDIRLANLLRVHIDGIPLDLASSLLPFRTKLRFSLLTHVHLHARSQKRHEADSSEGSKRLDKVRVSRVGMQGLIESLESAIRRLRWDPSDTEWGDYYDATNYSSEGTDHKAELVGNLLDRAGPATVWDLGANTGVYSRLALDRGAQVVSWDIDPAAVEQHYLALRAAGPRPLIPLLLDLTNPTSALGWANEERMSLRQRGPADLAMALALVHHLAISNNVPLPRVAEFLASVARSVIFEWVPKEDSQVQRLLATREDIFDEYSRDGLEQALGPIFETVAVEPIRDSSRVVYLLRSRHE